MEIAITTLPSFEMALVAFVTMGFALGWIAAGYDSGDF